MPALILTVAISLAEVLLHSTCISNPVDERNSIMRCTLPCLVFGWTAANLLCSFPGILTGLDLWMGMVS